MKVEAGTAIGQTECPGCGANVPIKVNRVGGVYFYCARVLGTNEATGKPEKCMTRFNFGRTASNKMIDEYLKTQGKKDVEQVIDREPEAGGATAKQSGEEPAGTSTEPYKRKAGNGFFSSFFD